MDIRSYTKEYHPDMYHSMEKDGTLDEHISNCAQSVHDYVDNAVERVMNSEEYRVAEKRGDVDTMRKLCYTERMFATSEAERMFVCFVDDEFEEKLDAFEMRINYYGLYNNGAFANIYFDKNQQKYVRINEDDLDEYGYDEHYNYYPSYEEIQSEMALEWSDLIEEFMQMDDIMDRRYELNRYLELVFENNVTDPGVDKLRELFIEEAEFLDDESPFKKIVGFYVNKDDNGLYDYIHYMDEEKADAKKDYSEAIAALKELDRQNLLRELSESVCSHDFEYAYELGQKLSDALKVCVDAAERLEELDISIDEV